MTEETKVPAHKARLRAGDETGTPQGLFDHLNEEFKFTLDVCASKKNHKMEQFIDVDEHDALKLPWTGNVCWMNPPYSRGNIGRFMKKAFYESKRGALVVALVRHDPSTDWYQQYVFNKAHEVRFLDERVEFVDADDDYNFPLALVVWRSIPLLQPTLYFYWGWPEEIPVLVATGKLEEELSE